MKEDYIVKGFEDVEQAYKSFHGDMFAGVMPTGPLDENVDPDAGHMMFWYSDSEEPKVDDSLILWSNGSPRCSSFYAGLLFEFVSWKLWTSCLRHELTSISNSTSHIANVCSSIIRSRVQQ